MKKQLWITQYSTDEILNVVTYLLAKEEVRSILLRTQRIQLPVIQF